MITLEEIQPGTRIRGLLRYGTAEILAVRALGRRSPGAIDVTYRTPNGRCGTRVVCRAHQRRLHWAPRPRFAHPRMWHTCEAPRAMTSIPYRDSFTDREVRRFELGLVPMDMGEKWFIHFRLGTLYLHRSWTGYCIFTVKLENERGRHVVIDARVCSDPTRYQRSTDAYEASLLRFLVRDLLLGQRLPFPLHPDEAADTPLLLEAHHIGGQPVSDRMLGVQR